MDHTDKVVAKIYDKQYLMVRNKCPHGISLWINLWYFFRLSSQMPDMANFVLGDMLSTNDEGE